MNKPHAPREAALTVLFCCITIVVSAALIAVPMLRLLPASKLALFLMTMGMIVIFVRRESKRRTLGLTIPQIYTRAKLGRKFAPPAIEFVAAVLWCWATTVTS